MPDCACITAPCNACDEHGTPSLIPDWLINRVKGEQPCMTTMELRTCPDGSIARTTNDCRKVCPGESGYPLSGGDRLVNAAQGMKWLALGVAALFILIVWSSRK